MWCNEQKCLEVIVCIHSRLSGQRASWDHIRGAPVFYKGGLHSSSASHGTRASLSLLRKVATSHRLQGLQVLSTWYCQKTPSEELIPKLRPPSTKKPVTSNPLPPHHHRRECGGIPWSGVDFCGIMREWGLRPSLHLWGMGKCEGSEARQSSKFRFITCQQSR